MNWIPVSERLPDAEYLISTSVLFVADGVTYSGHYDSCGWFYCDEWVRHIGRAQTPKSKEHPDYSIYKNDPVATHWMPLPEPPKEGT